MHEENKYSEFDSIVRNMLYDAQEEPVPPRVWKAVSASLNTRRYLAGWSHPIIGMACAAALALGVIFTPRIVENLPHRDSTLIVLASASRLDISTDFPEPVFLIDRLSPATIRARSSTSPQSPDTAVPVQSESATASVKVPAAQSQDETSEKTPCAAAPSRTGKSVSSPKKEGPDPLDLLALEESRRNTHKLRTDMDVRGVVSSNDGISLNPRIGRMMARSGSGSYASGLSQSSEDTFGIPVSFQIGARVFINDWLGFGAGISYSLLTRSFTGNRIESGVVKQTGLDILHTAQYVGVPVNVYFNITNSNRTAIYVYAGATGEKCLSSRYLLRNSTGPESISETVDPLQWSAGLGFGMQYDITPHLGFYIDPSARYYFNCAQPRTVRTSKPFMFDFAVGLRLDL